MLNTCQDFQIYVKTIKLQFHIVEGWVLRALRTARRIPSCSRMSSSAFCMSFLFALMRRSSAHHPALRYQGSPDIGPPPVESGPLQKSAKEAASACPSTPP